MTARLTQVSIGAIIGAFLLGSSSFAATNLYGLAGFAESFTTWSLFSALLIGAAVGATFQYLLTKWSA
jgi:hypothetical protein